MFRPTSGVVGEGPTFIVIEDKRLGVDDGEYHIPGEALAVACHNYIDLKMRFAQTIFARYIYPFSHPLLLILKAHM